MIFVFFFFTLKVWVINIFFFLSQKNYVIKKTRNPPVPACNYLFKSCLLVLLVLALSFCAAQCSKWIVICNLNCMMNNVIKGIHKSSSENCSNCLFFFFSVSRVSSGAQSTGTVGHPCAHSSEVLMKEDFKGFNVTSSVS